MNDKVMYAPDYTGGGCERYEFSPETGLFHWHGHTEYCGYTADDLQWRIENAI